MNTNRSTDKDELISLAEAARQYGLTTANYQVSSYIDYHHHL